MLSKLRIIPILLLLIVPAMADLVEDANRHYTEGRFKEAAEQYEAALEQQPGSSNVWYNLGNARYRLKEPGLAALAYERALALDPSHPEAAFNLRHLREQSGAKLPEATWTERLLRLPESWLGARAVPWIASLSLWAALVLLIPLTGLRRAPVAGVALLLASLWAGGAWSQQVIRGERWIVVGAKAQPFVAPLNSAKAIGSPIPAGSEVRLLQETGDWVYVRLPDGNRGWLPRQAAEPVAPVRRKS